MYQSVENSVHPKDSAKKATALNSGAGGRKFKSCHPDQYLQGATFPRSLFLFVLRAYSGPKQSSQRQFECSMSDVFGVPGQCFDSGADPVRFTKFSEVRGSDTLLN